jgi:hypothetical protein
MAFVWGIFFGQALADLGEMVAHAIEFEGDGLKGGEFSVGIALVGDELAANFRGGQPAIDARGAEGRVGLEVVLDEVADIVEQVGQMGLDGLASATGGGILASDASTVFLQGLAEGIASPPKQPEGLSLTQSKCGHGVGHITPEGWPTRKVIGGTRNQVHHFRCKFHDFTSCQGLEMLYQVLWTSSILERALMTANRIKMPK